MCSDREITGEEPSDAISDDGNAVANSNICQQITRAERMQKIAESANGMPCICLISPLLSWCVADVR